MLSSGAVVSEQARASEVGRAVLQAGGNAADAIIAAVLAVGVISMYHSDIGGGGFALIRTPDGRHEALDFRQCAPGAAHEDLVMNKSSPKGLTVAVPGQLRGLEELHGRHGRLPWRRLFEESIRMAEEGVEMKHDQYTYTSKVCSQSQQPPFQTSRKSSIIEQDQAHDFLFDANGHISPLGSKVERPGYGAFLRQVAAHGADALYNGPVAAEIVKAVNDEGGIISLDDLKKYKCRWLEPIQGKYGDKTLWSVPSPASGAIWIHSLGMLSSIDGGSPSEGLEAHRLLEVLKLAYPQRTHLGDPSFVPGIDAIEQKLVNPHVCEARSKMVNDNRTHPIEYYKQPLVDINFDNGTSNMTVIDSDGMIISITTTVGSNFGSKIITPTSGICLNDSMHDFSSKGIANWTGYEPSVANYIAPGKRPLSSSCPYIVEDADGRPVLTGGAAGGSQIISGNVQVARNVLALGMTAGEAVRRTRLHNQLSPNTTVLEASSSHQGIEIEGYSKDTAEALSRLGHEIEWVYESRAVPCAIKISHDAGGIKVDASADPRKEDSGASTYVPTAS